MAYSSIGLDEASPAVSGRTLLGLLGLVAAFAAPEPAAAQPAALSKELIARGKYVFGVAAGCGCHTEPKKVATELNAGGRKYDGPFGTVYATNITPDPETGIGKWTDDQIITAIRAGRRPNGERLIPVHPYPTFNGMAEEDLRAVVAYLRSVPPVRRANTPKKISVPMFESVFLPAWLAAFAPRETPPATAPTSGLARGEYLVRAVGHCGECHTPRGMTQALDNSALPRRQSEGQGARRLRGAQYHAGHGHGHREVDRRADHDVHRHRQSTQWRRRRRAHGRGHPR